MDAIRRWLIEDTGKTELRLGYLVEWWVESAGGVNHTQGEWRCSAPSWPWVHGVELRGWLSV